MHLTQHNHRLFGLSEVGHQVVKVGFYKAMGRVATYRSLVGQGGNVVAKERFG